MVKKNFKNYQVYSQALYLAKEYEQSLAPLGQAASRAPDGKLYNQLGTSLIALNRWKEADSAFGKALQKGKLQNAGQTLISRGLARFEQKNYDGAKSAFRQALKYEKVAAAAQNWIKYVESEEFRIKELQKEIVINTDVEV